MCGSFIFCRLAAAGRKKIKHLPVQPMPAAVRQLMDNKPLK
jgi:hypothetical protein